jgi:hypothetical protein
MTESGMGMNVEAAIVLDEEEGDGTEDIRKIAAAIDRWRPLEEDGVFPIRDLSDIQRLIDDGIIDIPQPEPPPRMPRDPNRPPATGRALGRRRRMWRPRRGARVTAGTTPHPQRPVATPVHPPVAPVVIAVPAMKWCKKMPSADAQWVAPGTNPTRKLRLTEARHKIELETYFRYDLFSVANWQSVPRGRNLVDVADIPFDVTVRGVRIGPSTLRVDHSLHRARVEHSTKRSKERHNVPTVLAWGRRLISILGSTSHADDWVVIERDAAGQFKLTIQQNRPTWAP